MYISTRNNAENVHASEAIVRGMVPAGGLYLPDRIPQLTPEEIEAKASENYQELAKWIFSYYLDDFTADEIAACVEAAYTPENFARDEIAPLIKLEEDLYVLELWHGPTAAFKDMALQILPHFLVTALKKVKLDKEIVILVATSGDTGKAALEGFRNVEGTQIIVFYPAGGVSEVQELQMLTTEGNNTHVIAVEGNFDDCQRAVKEVFADHAYGEKLDAEGFRLSSANSINWGRLLPQIVYYFAAYMQLLRRDQISFGDQIDFVVPTGNFGNILAGWYAREMGLPIRYLVCASNENSVLTDFFHTGVYDANRPFVKTESPSMDILVSSNLERFLYLMNGKDGEQIANWMEALRRDGVFKVDDATKANMDAVIRSGSANDQETLEAIASIYESSHYLLDTHTAVGIHVVEGLPREVPIVVDSTANPFKFVGAVYEALEPDEDRPESELELITQLSKTTNTPVHRALSALFLQGSRPTQSITTEEIQDTITAILTEQTER